MYAASLCRACLRVSGKKGSRINFCAPLWFSSNASVQKTQTVCKICKPPYVLPSMSFWRDWKKEIGFAVHKTHYSTLNSSPAGSVQDNVNNTDETIKESQDAATVGPPLELMQNLGDEDQRKIKVLWMELEVLLQSGYRVPKKMSSLHWEEAMTKETRSQRIKFYSFLAGKESRKESDEMKKIARKLAFEKVLEERKLAEVADPSIVNREYGLNKNAIFMRFYNSSMNNVYNSWQCQAIQFGQSIVVDLGYDEQMVSREVSNCADQLQELYAFNKINRQPFHLHLCNAGPDNKVLKYLEKYIPNLHCPTCMITVTEKSYLDIFPKQKLVYLTPHCKNDLTTYDHDAVYIIGGIVDKTIQQPMSLGKAKREGIAMARLPLDQYLEWGVGNKSLTLDQVMKIMLDIKNTNCWNTALKHVPKRKLKTEETRVPIRRPRIR